MKYKDISNIIKDRKVGGESRRTYVEKLENGFFDKWMSGNVCEVGNKGYEEDVASILPETTTYNIGDKNYDGLNIPTQDQTYDALYSSHVLEHIEDYKATIKEWYRVVKIGGYIIVVVPHQFLYERKWNKPSRWNQDHKHFLTPATLLKMVEESLKPNSYRVRLLEDGDQDYDYSNGNLDVHPSGAYEITLILQKIETPSWKIQ